MIPIFRIAVLVLLHSAHAVLGQFGGLPTFGQHTVDFLRPPAPGIIIRLRPEAGGVEAQSEPLLRLSDGSQLRSLPVPHSHDAADTLDRLLRTKGAS